MITNEVDKNNPEYWESVLQKHGLGVRQLGLHKDVIDEPEDTPELEPTRGRRSSGLNKDFEQLRTKFDSKDGFVSSGHQIKKIRAHSRVVPDWTADDQAVQKLLLRSFPNLKTSPYQRKFAGRWVRVIHLFYRMGLSRTEIAKEMRVRDRVIKDALRSIKRASRGLRADGRK